MKAYTYSAAELGMTELPRGTLRLGGFENTENPAEADAFVIPCDIRHVTNDLIHELPYMKGNEQRHCMYCISDRPNRAIGLPAIIFRADANRGLVAQEPTTVPWAWPVNPTRDIDRFIHAPREGFKYDVCFVGWNSTQLNDVVCNSVQRQGHLATYVHLNPEFYGSYESRNDTDKIVRFRNLFLDVMHNSRLSLCARSIAEGVVRYRFYEALAMGRIPVHFNDNVYLPFQDKIDYNRCSIHLPESDGARCGDILRKWLDTHSDDEIIEMGKYGRWAWETWMDGDRWDDLFGLVVKERLAQL